MATKAGMVTEEFCRELLNELLSDPLTREVDLGHLDADRIEALLKDSPAANEQLDQLSQKSIPELLKDAMGAQPQVPQVPQVPEAVEDFWDKAPNVASALSPQLEKARQRMLAQKAARADAAQALAAEPKPAVQKTLSPQLEIARQRMLAQKAAQAKAAQEPAAAPKTLSPQLEMARQRMLAQKAAQAVQQAEAILENTDAYDAKLECKVQADGMLARVNLIPPTKNGAGLNGDQILAALAEKGIKAGIKADFIARLGKHPVYGLHFKIAEGKAAVDGIDGKVEYHFNMEENLVPKMNEDGTVDYKDLSYGKSVLKGDLLCDIIPPTEGVDGYDVFGKVLPCHHGAEAPPLDGVDTAYSEDHTQLFATADGEIGIKNGKVVIKHSMTLKNVDSASGNISFAGSVTVLGDVKSGFSMRVGGDIKISGIAEGAALAAGGNVVIGKGMNGGGVGSIDAGGIVRSFFLENVEVKAKGDVYADVILNSNITCGGNLSISGSRGCLVGGSCLVSGELRTKDIGNESEIPTRVELAGTSEEEKQRKHDVEQLARFEESISRLNQITTAMARSADMSEEEKQKTLVRVACAKLRLKEEIAPLKQKLKPAQGDDESDEDNAAPEVIIPKAPGRVIVFGSLYPNVSITIGGITVRISQMRKFCVLRKKNGKILFGNAAHY